MHMIVVGEGRRKGMQESGEEKGEKRNWRGGWRETHSIILSKRKEVRSTAAPGITPVTDLLPLPWL